LSSGIRLLTKEALQNVMILRFANRVSDPCWNSNYIDKVDILLSESIGIEGRVGFFDEVGALRDVVQNHALQVVAALAMEAPLTSSADHINDRRAELLAEVVPFRANQALFGQYTGYRDVKGVPKTSETDTFIHVTFTINNDRWRGTTWSITAGKALHRKATEVTIQFREAVSPAFIDDHCLPERNSSQSWSCVLGVVAPPPRRERG
jgi:glucose-6-phosphate 1-dehydrogenase